MGARSIRGQTALITGAARRIGRRIAFVLAREGVNIVAHYNRSQGEVLTLCDELGALGVRAWPVQADLQDIDGLIEKARAVAGPFSILVNNASTFDPGTLENLSWEEALSSLRINAWAPFALCRLFVNQTERGSIINILDTRIAGYDWKHVGYILSKHTLAHLTRMMALEFAPSISVNAVAPGLILPPPGETEEYFDRVKDSVPLKRHGDADDIAEAVLYLTTSTFITGQVIYVDGGRHLREQGRT